MNGHAWQTLLDRAAYLQFICFTGPVFSYILLIHLYHWPVGYHKDILFSQ